MKPPISRIGLGTVQFGIPYGIHNNRGQVPAEEATRIIATAIEGGITLLDTARVYGNAEEVVGRALDETGLKGSCTVCTKLDIPHGSEALSRDQLVTITRTSIDLSRKALGTEVLDVLLLHRPEHRQIAGGSVWETLLEYVDRGVIGSLGVSAATGPEDLDEFITDSSVKMIQIPLNPLDARWDRSHVLTRLRERPATLVNRSTFLQGLLLMTPDRVAARLPIATQTHQRWLEACAEAGTPPAELAIRYSLSRPDLDVTLIGVDSIAQLETNLDLAKKAPLDDATRKMIEDRCGIDDPEIVNPARWPAQST